MNNKDQWHQLAPLVWFTVRRSLEAYLTSVGVGQPLSLTGPKDLTPTVWKASVTFMKYTSEDGKFDGYSYVPRDLAAQLSLVPAAAAVGHEPLYVEMYRNEPALPSGLGDLNPGQGPDVTFIGRGNSLASLKLKFQCPEMTFRIPARGTPYGTVMPINIASFKFDETIEASSGVFTITQKKKGLGERNYTMVIKGSVANLGPAGNAS